MYKFILFLMLIIATNCYADSKISEMTNDAAPTTDDIFPTVDSPGSAPANRKVTLGNLKTLINTSIASANINWQDINRVATINTGAINWSSMVGGVMPGAGMNWTDVIGLIKPSTSFATGQIPIRNLATGTPDGTKFIRDDGTLVTPSGSGSGTVNSGTASQVGYYAGSGTAISGNANLVFDGTNVGISTANNTGILNLGGTLTLQNQETISNATNGQIRFSMADSNGTEALIMKNSSTANRIVLDTDTGVTQIQLVPTSLILSGEVITAGVGTPTPNVGFRSGSSNLPERIYIVPNGSPVTAIGGAYAALKMFGTDFSVDTTNYDDFGIFNGNPYDQINSKCNGSVACKQLAISHNDTNFMAVFDNSQDNGNVGIGTVNVTGQKVLIEQTAAADAFRVNDSAADTTPFLIDQFGNVGIGSLTPGKALDIIGTVRATGFSGDGSGLTGIGGSISGLTTNKLSKATSSTTIGDSQVFDDGTNVGIGSVVPGQKLDVIGSVRAIQFLGDGSALTGISGSGTVNSGTVNQIARYSATGTAVSGSTNLMSDNTNVGIGTIAPTAEFQINNNALPFVVDSGSNVGIGTNITGNEALSVMSGNVGIGTWKAGNTFQVGTGTGFQVGSTGNFISIGGSTSATLTSSTLSLTGSPVVFKNISASAGTSAVLIGSAAAGGFAEVRSTSGTGVNDYVKITGGTNGASETARFLGNGNIGVGTVVPSGKLIIVGNVGIGTIGVGDLYTSSTIPPSGGMIIEGNVGIGTYNVTGKFNIGGTTGMGWTVKSGANTACNTTCPASSACVFGEDTSVIGTIVACTDATADICVCAGP